MIKKSEYEAVQKRAAEMIENSGIFITEEEKTKIEVVDFGLNHLEIEGAQILTLFSTERVSAKIIALFPNQTEPEHWHPEVGMTPGKEETLRVVSGVVRFGIPGDNTVDSKVLPKGKEEYYTVRHEVILEPGDQLTLAPGTKHWFQALEEGAVMYTISSCVRDLLDKFSDPIVKRITKIDE